MRAVPSSAKKPPTACSGNRRLDPRSSLYVSRERTTSRFGQTALEARDFTGAAAECLRAANSRGAELGKEAAKSLLGKQTFRGVRLPRAVHHLTALEAREIDGGVSARQIRAVLSSANKPFKA
jgi:hypothetical protein